jgi:acylglycerol lipase
MLHGLNSHLGHGAHIANELAENGIITVGFDHRGFGRSEGEPGYAESLDRHVEDSLIFIGKMK